MKRHVFRSLWVRHLGWLLVFGLAAGVGAPACGSDAKGSGSASGSGGQAGASGEGGSAGEAGTTSTSSGGTNNTSTSGVQPPACGDTQRSGDEECDDGNRADGDGCDAFCQVEQYAAACGDAELQSSEECDDANLLSGDGCSASCRREACGNDRVDAGEECDPPVENDCSATCLELSPNCGDGNLQEDEFEQCDDANDEPSDGCHECRITCGNGRVDGALGEACEPEHSPGACSESCRWLPVCGDGLVEAQAGEECDPSNGRTCVDCKTKVTDPPDCEGGAGGASAGEEECPPVEECVALGEPGQLVTNGTFADDYAGWAPHSGFISLNGVSEGVPDPKALEVSLSETTVRSVSGAYQCIPIEPGAEYELSAEYFIPADAPGELNAGVTVLLYAGTACEGSWVSPPGNGPNGRVRGAWTPYEWLIETSTLLVDGEVTEGRMLLRVNVAQPPGVTGARILWDNVSVTEIGSLCGDCVVDENERCDDGNQTAGDGCNPLCDLESCGNGQLEGTEHCDDGDNAFDIGDLCSPACQAPSACDTCALGYCNTDPAVLDDCWSLTGEAEAGPRAGAAKSLLCADLRACVLESACDQVPRTTEGVLGAFIENCYCGTAGDACFDSSAAANGSCKGEVEAALETDDPLEIAQRLGGADPDYPIFSNVRQLLSCERSSCAECLIPSTCGDGRVQDRNLDYTFEVEREEVPCRDDLTHTGRGCSFEECDDGNLVPGDGCDENCFVEACGNHVTQAGETCDDGNDDSDDGCDACQAQFECGDSEVFPGAEQCDPPNTGPLCSMAQYQADPTQCGCDVNCSYSVCGNEVVQPGEQCDPPNGSICGDDCQFIGGGPCDDCIQATPYLGEFSEEFCDNDPLCFAVKRCVLSPIDREDGYQTCFAPRAAECYCGVGADLDACENPDFEPTGPCVEEIRAGFPPEIDENAQITTYLYEPAYPTGVAMLIALEASYYCADACGLGPPQ